MAIYITIEYLADDLLQVHIEDLGHQFLRPGVEELDGIVGRDKEEYSTGLHQVCVVRVIWKIFTYILTTDKLAAERFCQ